MYKVVADFKDLRDNGHAYKVGDIYPHTGEADEARVKVLISPTTQRGALIEYVADVVAEAQEDKPKRGRKKKDGV